MSCVSAKAKSKNFNPKTPPQINQGDRIPYQQKVTAPSRLRPSHRPVIRDSWACFPRNVKQHKFQMECTFDLL